MPKQEHVSVRLPVDLLERVDAYRRKLERLNRQPVSRSTAFRALLDAGLESQEGGK